MPLYFTFQKYKKQFLFQTITAVQFILQIILWYEFSIILYSFAEIFIRDRCQEIAIILMTIIGISFINGIVMKDHMLNKILEIIVIFTEIYAILYVISASHLDTGQFYLFHSSYYALVISSFTLLLSVVKIIVLKIYKKDFFLINPRTIEDMHNGGI